MPRAAACSASERQPEHAVLRPRSRPAGPPRRAVPAPGDVDDAAVSIGQPQRGAQACQVPSRLVARMARQRASSSPEPTDCCRRGRHCRPAHRAGEAPEHRLDQRVHGRAVAPRRSPAPDRRLRPSAGPGVRAAGRRAQPAPAKACTIASPMPREAPVTSNDRVSASLSSYGSSCHRISPLIRFRRP